MIVACEMNAKISVWAFVYSSPYGLAFYEHFGFTIEHEEKNTDTPRKTPMSYIL